ncbi:calcium-binding protein [Methylibium sp. Pch-M]|uniref:calcium-binding protein n=1 Tax=Methylibium sp. Pch-M TaxID=2082386 RepID=UPI0013EB9AFC|nr:calcium-binding protein [Methylibium sp. Pch-M]
MTTIEQAFFECVLADLSYLGTLSEGMSEAQFSAEAAKRITVPLAQEVAARFEILAVKSDPASDYQGVVFRDKITKELYVANRGTESLIDILDADLDLALGSGVAAKQAASMVNWWAQISHSGTTPVTQVGVAGPIFVTASSVQPTGEVAQALAEAGGKVRVVGHSLGGHLTTVFSSLFAPQVSHSSTFNGAGLFSTGSKIGVAGWTNALRNWLFGTDSSLSRLGQLLGVTPQLAAAGAKQDNFFATNGLSLTTNDVTFTQLGVRIGLANEQSTNPLNNHFLYKQTDLLALGVALEKLMPGLSIAQLNSLAEASSNAQVSSLENLLDGLRRQLQGLAVSSTPAIDDGGDWAQSVMPTQRVAFQTNLKALTDTSAFQSIAGKVRIDPSSADLRAKARNDFSAMASLLTLSPLVLTATDTANQSLLDTVLQGAWGQAYADWQADKAMSQAEREADQGIFTDRWIADRSAMLDTLVRANQNDETFYNDLAAKDVWVYEDKASNILIARQPVGPGPFVNHYLSFGDQVANMLAGAAKEDHLYGGAGDDELTGLGGADHLEGNAGDDVLNGGDGTDTLLGGSGADTLNGGLGNDQLKGGAGSDTYSFSGSFGIDTIDDAGADGSISVAGLGDLRNLTLKKISSTDWQTEDRSVTCSLIQPAGQAECLIITVVGTASNGAIRINGWVDGRFGITLAGTATQPTTTNVLTGDYIKATNTEGTQYRIGGDGNYLSDGVQVNAADVLNGSAAADAILGLGGNDGIAGGAGDDLIEGGAGDDLLLGGAGADTINGGEGNDEILGSAAGWIDRPVSTNFTPPGGGGPELSRGFSWVIYTPTGQVDYLVSGTTGAGIHPNGESTGNLIDGGAGNDRIGAGSGTDIVHGGEGGDLIVGMGRGDVLYGDAGEDHIDGDGPQSEGWNTPFAEHGDDVLVGGAGDDQLRGQGGSDLLSGGDDDDRLYGDDFNLANTPLSIHGNDWLDGGSGDDYLQGEGGADVLYGGVGNDTLIGDDDEAAIAGSSHGEDSLYGEDGNDMLLGHGGSDMLDGGAGDDWLDGDGDIEQVAGQHHGDDYLSGGSGADVLIGRGGRDILYGGVGNDELHGDADGSLLAGQFHGIDYLDGEAGDDRLWGFGGDDILIGGTGVDYLDGDAAVADLGAAFHGDDDLDGGDGDDTLRGSGGNDVLRGGEGSDVISGDRLDLAANLHGADTLEGGSGNDQLWGDGGDDALFGGEGNDWLAGEDQSSSSANSALTGNDALYGGGGNDTLVGGNGSDVLAGDDGDDALYGGAGDDVLRGGAGNDMLDGGLGNDTILFGRGDGQDRINGGNQGAGNAVQLMSGVATADLVFKQVYESSTASNSGLEIGIAGTADKLTLTGAFAFDNPGAYSPVQQLCFDDGTNWNLAAIRAALFAGTAGDDNLTGTVDVETINGGAGNDTLIGGTGDTLAGGVGNDKIVGSNSIVMFGRGDGSDTVSGSENVVKFKPGVTASDLSFRQVDELSTGRPSALEVSIAGTTDKLTLSRFFYFEGQPFATRAVMELQFADGSALDRDAIVAKLFAGTAGDDTIFGSMGDDTVSGGAGNDFLDGWLGGNDVLMGNDGNDGLIGRGGNDTLIGGLGNDYLIGDVGDDVFIFNAGDGNDLITPSVYDDRPDRMDTLSFGTGITTDDLVLRQAPTGQGNPFIGLPLAYQFVVGFRNASDSVTIVDMMTYSDDPARVPLQYFRFADGTVWNSEEIRSRLLSGTSGDDFLSGSFMSDTISGGAGNDTLNGYGMNPDTLLGGLGDDVYLVCYGDGADRIEDTDGDDSIVFLRRYPEEEVLPSDVSVSVDGDDVLLTIGAYTDQPLRLVGAAVEGGAGTIESVQFTNGAVWTAEDLRLGPAIRGTDGNDVLVGTGAADQIIGAAGNDVLRGLDGNDVLQGDSGDDRLDGGAGADTMTGGTGNDTYVIDESGDVVVELAAGGTDSIETSVSFSLLAEMENLTLTGNASINAVGNSLDNTLIGNVGSNRLDGGGGADSMAGGSGDDTYVVSDAADSVSELAGAGVDSIESSVSWTLGSNIENLTLVGALAINGTGNTLSNRLTGNGADNVLNGGGGADTLIGGAGNDGYVVDTTADVVTELANEGTDGVSSSITYTISANVENLTLTGTSAVNGTGNALDNVLTGNSAANVLTGGAGNDTYFVGTGDTVTESASAGTDTVSSSITWTLGNNLENLMLTGSTAINGTGNTLVNVLTGNGAANTLDGSSGADTLIGGAGNDRYVVDNTADVVTELASEGTDLVSSIVTYTLAANVENLTLTGPTAINGTGNALDNVLTGNSAANVLTGSTGNDTYVVGTGDTVTEAVSAGTDTVSSSITWILGSNLENLTLTGTSAVNGTGNALDNVLTGNSAANVLTGGTGNDTYVVGTGDAVTEAASSGTDTVQSSITWTLGSNLENLTLTGTSTINGTGNTLANVLAGNTAANTLDGGTGADTLVGGAGNDSYVVDNTADVVTELTAGGTDGVSSSVTYTLSANVENLTLTGSTVINGTGNASDNVLAGNSAANVLSGGTGNDTYVVGTGDTVTEAAGAGADTVQSSITWTLGNNLENLTLTGSSAINGTGNTLDNLLTGNSAANVLTGGAGNDTYVVGTGDTVTEAASAGTDTVSSAITWTLGTNLENLTLTGSSAVNGTGNTLNNVLTGNSANNTLTGNAGNDTLDGGAGTDTLAGGTGNDSYVLGRGHGADTLQENDATAGNVDVLQFLSGVSTDQIWLRQVSNNLEVSIIGTSDKATLTNWYLSNAYHVEQFKTSDGKTLLDSKVQNLVSAMAGFAPPAAGQTTLPPSYQTALAPVIAANWNG